MADLKKVRRHILTGTCLLSLSESTPPGVKCKLHAIWPEETLLHKVTSSSATYDMLSQLFICRISMLSWETL